MSWPRGWPFTDDLVNRMFQRFGADVIFEVLGNCILEELEDTLRAQDAAAIRRFHHEGWWHWAGAPTLHFPPGRLHHYFAVYDNAEARRRVLALSDDDRRSLGVPVPGIPGPAWGPSRLSNVRIQLHQRAAGVTDLACLIGRGSPADEMVLPAARAVGGGAPRAMPPSPARPLAARQAPAPVPPVPRSCGEPGSNLSRFRSMQHLGVRYVSGEADRIQMMGYAIAGSITGRAFAIQGARAAGRPEVPQVQGGARVPGGTGARSGTLPGAGPPPPPGARSGRTLPGVGPFRSLGGRSGQTLPGVGGLTPEEIGHAPTLPAPAPDIAHAPTLPGPRSGRTLRGVGRPGARSGRTLPGIGRPDAPDTLQAAFEEAVAAERAGAPRPAAGSLMPPGGRAEPMTEQQQRQFLHDAVDQRPMRNFSQSRPGADPDREYVRTWRACGRDDAPPPHGFFIYDAEGHIRHIFARGRF